MTSILRKSNMLQNYVAWNTTVGCIVINTIIMIQTTQYLIAIKVLTVKNNEIHLTQDGGLFVTPEMEDS